MDKLLLARVATALACLGCETAAPSRPSPPSPLRAADAVERPLAEQVRELAAGSRPGAKHAALDPLAGEWEVSVADGTGEGGAPTTYRGSASLAWVLSGRFLRWDASVDFAGATGTTTGYLGYDLRSAQYQLMMISDLATGMEVARGRGDLEKGGILFALEQVDPSTGAVLRARSRLRLVSRDHFLLEQLAEGGGDRADRVWHYRRKAGRARRRKFAPTR